MLSRMPLRRDEVMLLAAPLFHAWGLAALQVSTPILATVVLIERFDPEECLKTIERERCTALVLVPVMMQRILELPAAVLNRYDTSSLKVVASSGSPIPGAAVVKFMDTFGDLLYNFYGSTEVSWATIADPTDLRQPRSRRCAGRRRPAPHAGKSPSAHALPLPPRVGNGSNSCHRGMHRRACFLRHGSRGTNSRRGIAAIDFRRSVSACSAGQALSDTSAPPAAMSYVGSPSGGPSLRLAVRSVRL
jgi:acyl-CoA synthetase (AMP-forming)/AMP-acid ligase II